MNTRFTVVSTSDADEGSNAELTYIVDVMGKGSRVGREGVKDWEWDKVKWGLCGEGRMGVKGKGREGREENK